jgi:hypothetical protein
MSSMLLNAEDHATKEAKSSCNDMRLCAIKDKV